MPPSQPRIALRPMQRPLTASLFAAAPALFLLDLLLVAVAWPAAMALLGGGMAGKGIGAVAPLLHPVAYLLFLYSLGLYRRDAIVAPTRAIGRVPLAAAFGALAASAALALLPGDALGAEGRLPAWFAASVIGLSAAGCAARLLFRLLRRLGLFRRRLLIIGAGARAFDLVLLLRREGSVPAYDVACVPGAAEHGPDPRLAADPALRLFPPGTGFLAAARAFGAEQIVVAPDERRGLAMGELLACRTAGFPVSEYLLCLEREIGRIDMKRLELGWLLYSDGFGASQLDHALKRTLDVAVSLALLAAALPFLAVAALAVKLQDGGPVLYHQTRVTRDGRAFRIMKLRTMLVNAEAKGATWAAERDPRITAIGRFLRRTRLDELPQLLNVLAGDMSLVGPRPERPEFVASLAESLPLYAERHRVKAGLTGWAQVNYPYGASVDDARSKLSYDLYYVKNFSLLLDLRILLQTLRVVFWPGGVR
jgi:sugar transferase (PEP-CTERM system associated)